LDIGDGRGLIRSKATVLFLKDIHRGDSLTVNTRVIEIYGASFIKNYQIYKEEMLRTEGETTLLVRDYNTRKPSRLPAAFKKAKKEFESEQTTSFGREAKRLLINKVNNRRPHS